MTITITVTEDKSGLMLEGVCAAEKEGEHFSDRQKIARTLVLEAVSMIAHEIAKLTGARGAIVLKEAGPASEGN
jgi:hypothetical protein